MRHAGRGDSRRLGARGHRRRRHRLHLSTISTQAIDATRRVAYARPAGVPATLRARFTAARMAAEYVRALSAAGRQRRRRRYRRLSVTVSRSARAARRAISNHRRTRSGRPRRFASSSTATSFGVFDPRGDIVPERRERGRPVSRRHALPVVLRAAAVRPSAAAPELDGQRRRRGVRCRPHQPRRAARRRHRSRPRRDQHLPLARAVERAAASSGSGSPTTARSHRSPDLAPFRRRLRRCVRGARHAAGQAGRTAAGRSAATMYVMRYRGLDDRERRAGVHWSRRPDAAERTARCGRCSPRAEGDRDDRVDVSIEIRGGRGRRCQCRSDNAFDTVLAMKKARTCTCSTTPAAVSSRARARCSTAGSIDRRPICGS